MKVLIASVACALILASSGCAKRQMMREQCEAAMRQQEMQRRQAAAGRRPTQAAQGAASAETHGEVAEAVAVKEGQLYGSYLVDDQGRALYLFTPDKSAEGSACYEACAEAWPPALAEGRPEARHPSIRDDQLGTIRRDDGSVQLTYNGWPLYYYAQDRVPGQVTGQDVHEFGGEWYLLDPEGERVDEEK